MPPTILREPFGGWTETYRVGNDAVEARVLADVGPRVVELRRAGGRNLFHLRAAELGGRGERVWRFRGGFRLWVAPERRPATYALDNTACEVTIRDAHTLTIVGPPQPEASIRKSLTLAVDATEPCFTVVSEIVNVGREPVTYAPWSLAALRPGGRAFLPLDVGPVDALDRVRRLVLWSYATLGDARYRLHDALVEIDHACVLGGPAPRRLAPERTSDESKIGVDSSEGWLAYLLDGTLLVTHAPVVPGARADGGATLEAYSSREFVELEHLGVLRTMAPGARAELREEWRLFTDVALPPVGADGAVLRAALAPYVRAAATLPSDAVPAED